MTTFTTKWNECLDQGELFSVYESNAKMDEAVEKLKANYLLIGKIVRAMKGRGASYNHRMFFANYVMDIFMPQYHMSTIPAEVIPVLEDISLKFERMPI